MFSLLSILISKLIDFFTRDIFLLALYLGIKNLLAYFLGLLPLDNFFVGGGLGFKNFVGAV